MEDRLLGNFASRGDEVHALGGEGRLDCPADVDRCSNEELAQGRFDFPEVSYMTPWDHESVPEGCWVQGKEGYPRFPFADDVSGGVFSSRDRAEIAIRPPYSRCRHRSTAFAAGSILVPGWKYRSLFRRQNTRRAITCSL